MTLLTDDKHFSARWIGRDDICLIDWRAATQPAPLFRRIFTLERVGDQVEAFVAGLGFFELYINGRRVGDAVLEPTVAIYDRHWKYRCLDVSDYLQPGTNVVGLVVGNGWYNCQSPEVWHFDKATWRDYPKMIFQLEIDGEPVLISDTSWQVRPGFIVFDSLRGGESHDARREFDWLNPDADAPDDEENAWRQAAIVPGPGGLAVRDLQQPCQILETLPMHPIAAGSTIFAAPRNLAGWARLTARGTAGSVVTLRFGERLTPDDSLDADHVGMFIQDGTFQRDIYTLKGDSDAEIWEPRFTYHGFQYVEVQITGDATLERLEAREVGTDFVRHGRLATSESALTELEADAIASVRSNSVGIPTDCPHREKNGWTSEAQLTLETALYTFDAASFYAAFVDLMADVQRPNGQFPGMTPTSGWGYNWGNGPVYDSAFFTIPYQLYLFTGDCGLLERHFSSMLRYVDFCRSIEDDGLLRFGLGDWLPPRDSPRTPRDLVTTAFYHYTVTLAADIAEILSRSVERDKLRDRAKDIRQAFNREFHQGDGHYGDDLSTPLALALNFNLVEDSHRSATIRHLAAHMAELDGRVDYGTVGSKAVPRALLENGLADAALRLMTQTDYPSYRYWRQTYGATTFFEDWEGNKSRNHGAFVDIIACMYRYFGGLRPDPACPGQLIIQPIIPNGLKDFRAEYRGYVCAWEKQDRKCSFEIIVPDGALARIRLPGQPEQLQSPGTLRTNIPV